MATPAQLLEDSLLLIWNDRNAEQRLAVMQQVYAPDIAFFESDTSEAVVGYQALNALINNLQAGWPASFLFALSKPGQTNHQVQHAAWTLGTPGEAPAATGMDVALIENNLIKSLYLLLDNAAA
jgi:hypothetical protein